MTKKINVTYFDNYNIDFDEYKSAFQDSNEYTDEQMEEVSENDIWRWIDEELNFEWECFEDNIRYSDNNKNACVITGHLGLWLGKRDIEPTCCKTIWEAISKCVNNMDYVIVKQVNGHLEVTGIHHDGSNTFDIHLLNDKGYYAEERIKQGWGTADLTNRTYHKALKDYFC
jgi:hypothetical protein